LEEAAEINRVLLKEVEKPKYRPGQIVRMMRQEGYPRFNMAHHTDLWRGLDAQIPAKGFGVRMMDGTGTGTKTGFSACARIVRRTRRNINERCARRDRCGFHLAA
jgi:hypothetical protein